MRMDVVWVRSAMRSGGPPHGSLDTSEARARQDDRNRYVLGAAMREGYPLRTYLELGICDGGPYRTDLVPLPVATRWRHLYGEGGLFPVSRWRVGRSLARRLRR